MTTENGQADVTISVDDEHLHDVRRVADLLRAAGVSIDDVLEEVGVLTGSVDPAKIDGLQLIEGVGHVERGREYRLPPPDADVQ